MAHRTHNDVKHTEMRTAQTRSTNRTHTHTHSAEFIAARDCAAFSRFRAFGHGWWDGQSSSSSSTVVAVLVFVAAVDVSSTHSTAQRMTLCVTVLSHLLRYDTRRTCTGLVQVGRLISPYNCKFLNEFQKNNIQCTIVRIPSQCDRISAL